MKRCIRCVYPDSRPDAGFDANGLCSACRAYDARADVDWTAKSDALDRQLFEAHRGAIINGAAYDVVVPVSGGKDSHFQVLTLRERGMRVLAVAAGTDMLSAIGRRNLDNLKRFVDVLELTPHLEVRKKLIRIGLNRVGDLSWPEHCAIWAIPTTIAVRFKIPLVVWGEQPQREYATPAGVEPSPILDGRWVAEFGGMLGMRLDDLIGVEGLTEANLTPFRFPAAAELDEAQVKGIWLGDYLPWDGWHNAFIAQQHGFEVLPFPVEGSLANYENLDNHVTVLRDWLRFLKYGYGRATDIACNMIRRGRISRLTALGLIQAAERAPATSLGRPVEEVLRWCDIPLSEWEAGCEQWTNGDLFVKEGDRVPMWARRDDWTPMMKPPGYDP